MTPSFIGTPGEYKNFCYLGREFSKDLSAYVKEQINVDEANNSLKMFIVDGPIAFMLFFIAAQLITGLLGLLTPAVALLFIGVMFAYLFVTVYVVTRIIRRINRVTTEGIAYLRIMQPTRVRKLREFAEKEFPQEKK